jgi:hypothetical protein
MNPQLRPADRSRIATATFLIAVLLPIVLAGCAFLSGGPTTSPEPSASTAPPGPLVSVETRGGNCMAGACGSIVVLDSDGRVRTAAKPPNELGTVPTEDVTGLAALIEATDFDAIRAHPFTGTCPVAFDGQEVVYEFTTSDGVERIESCVTEIDPQHPLFEAIAGILGPFISLPTT